MPATKALAKEMLPIVDKPTIQFIVEEALRSGIEDILVVTGKSKRSIEDHFDSNFELEYNLKEKGKNDLLKLVDETTGIRLHFIRQSHPRGLGDAVLQAKAFVGNEPFVVMLGDDLMDITDTKAVPLTKQLMNDYEKHMLQPLLLCPFLMKKFLHTVLSLHKVKVSTVSIVWKPLWKNQNQKMLLLTLLLSDATYLLLKSLRF